MAKRLAMMGLEPDLWFLDWVQFRCQSNEIFFFLFLLLEIK